MRFLITGGAGFVGVNLIEYLSRSATAQITVLDNEVLGKREYLDGMNVDFIPGDIRDGELLEKILPGHDTVIHLAADTRVLDSIENPSFNFDVNVKGSFGLMEAARRAGIKRFVAASTGGAIIGDAEPPVHEGMVPHPLAPYGASKMAMEGYLSAYAGSYGMQSVALRFSNIYGPRSFHKGSVVAAFMRRALQKEPLVVYGDGTQTRDYLYVGDLVEGIVAAIEAGVSGVYQLGSGQPTDLNELIRQIEAVMGLSPGELPVQYEDFREGEVLHSWCRIDQAANAFGFQPRITLPEGLRRTWEWFGRQ
ncbi:MAG: NAD-dependent epimerase/dehydratase family protein [Desulfosudaceae bacterium]